MRPLAWGDSFGFRQVVTRSRDVTEPGQLAGLKIRTIQSPIYVKAVELMGASPTPMAFGEVYTSLQTGVIDGYEHDASTTLQQRFYEVAQSHGAHASHRRRARSLRVERRAGPPSAPTFRAALEQAALERPDEQRAMGPREDAAATDAARGARHDDPRYRRPRSSGRPPSGSGITEARALDVDAVARGDPRVTSVHGSTGSRRCPLADRALQWSIAVLVVAQAAVVGLQVVGRHVLRQPFPWTEEIARLLLGWLMCVGGIAALRHGQHPRVTALVRLSPGAAARRRSIAACALVLLALLPLARRARHGA